MESIRLDNYVQITVGKTRKEAKELISKGRVSVNKEIVKKSDIKVNENDEVRIDGVLKKLIGNVYIIMNKPSGVVSATEDKVERTVIDILNEKKEYKEIVEQTELFPIGRLDKDTTGLLLLTNDGELTHYLISPKRHVDKVYVAEVSGVPCTDAVKMFADGIMVGTEYKALPAKLEILERNSNSAVLKVTLHEGKFHQVKRMCHEIGCEVINLRRISFGNITLDESLKEGEARMLTDDELATLKKAVLDGKE